MAYATTLLLASRVNNLNEIPFDTLKYAQSLEMGGVTLSQVHSIALAEVIMQNIYSKREVEKMIETAIKEFHERTQQMKLEMKEMRYQFEKAVNRKLYATVSILGGLIVTMGAINSFIHFFIR